MTRDSGRHAQRGDVQQAPPEGCQSVIAQRIPTSPPIGTDEELPCDHCGKLERQHVAIIGRGLVCPMQGCTFSNSKSRALQSRISEVERLREALRSLVGAVERRWPNSDFTTSEHFAEPMNQARATLSQHRTTG